MGIHRKYSGTITRAAATVTGTQSITGIGGKPIMIIFNAVSDGDSSTFSKGLDDGNLSTSISGWALSVLLNLLGGIANVTVCSQSQTASVNVKTSANNGHSSNLTSMDSDGFTMNWTKIGSGLDITVKYIAIL